MREGNSELHTKAQRKLHAHKTAKKSTCKSTKQPAIKWSEWNPFERATGDALRQLNKRQRKQSPIDCAEEAPF
jgi:hypothetical protein